MDADLKRRWVEALRSGKYKQARRNLRSTDLQGRHSFCCLGVLCDLVDPDGWSTGNPRLHRLGDTFGMLKQRTTQDLGLTTRASRSKKLSQNRLAKMNDAFTSSFEDIANLIEKEL